MFSYFLSLSEWYPADFSHSWCRLQSPDQFECSQLSGPQEIHQRPARVHRRGPGNGKVPDRV